jgi:hypothetical protein
MTEVHELNVSAGSRHIQNELYRLPADRGAEQRRFRLTSAASVIFPPPQTFTTRTRVFFIVGFMTSYTTFWPSPQTPPL